MDSRIHGRLSGGHQQEMLITMTTRQVSESIKGVEAKEITGSETTRFPQSRGAKCVGNSRASLIDAQPIDRRLRRATAEVSKIRQGGIAVRQTSTRINHQSSLRSVR